MSIILTGDIHHAIGAADQPFCEHAEAALAVRYAQIAAQHGLKMTLFITGRAVIENGDDLRALLPMDHVELAGHGWNAFRPRVWYAAVRRLVGSHHGPASMQRRMIARTCATLANWSGRRVVSWRNHAYRHDRSTPRLLAEAGILGWSDEVNLERSGPYRDEGGVTVIPINTTPDHEYLRHGAWPRESAAEQWGGPAYDGDEWCARVCAQVERLVGAGGIATILAHPVCMQILDEWATFERLCAFLSRFPSLHVQDAAVACIR